MDSLQSNFDTLLKEWREYRDFFFAELKAQEKSVKERMATLVENMDEEGVLQFFYDTRIYPKMYEADLNLLTLRLITVYVAAKEKLKLGEEIKKEMDELVAGHRSTQRFTIRAGKAEPIDSDLIERTKKQFEQQAKENGTLEKFKELKNNNE